MSWKERQPGVVISSKQPLVCQDWLMTGIRLVLDRTESPEMWQARPTPPAHPRSDDCWTHSGLSLIPILNKENCRQKRQETR